MLPQDLSSFTSINTLQEMQGTSPRNRIKKVLYLFNMLPSLCTDPNVDCRFNGAVVCTLVLHDILEWKLVLYIVMLMFHSCSRFIQRMFTATPNLYQTTIVLKYCLFFFSECFPCPDGHFSDGNNDRCRPWTNCTAYGKKTLRAGTKIEDAICDDQDKQATTFQTSTLYLSIISRRSNGSTTAPTPFTSKDALSTTPIKKETNWGSLSLILICLTLLMVSGMSILLLIIQTTKKEKPKRPLVNGQLDGRSFRIPIQEEQIDSNSSLIKN
uniref:TNFR-Cys domain-containing protein n=1 Tax=Gopherus evgoodei TaxID=1825980 RepID=A0A8C4WNK1_9SAUR